MIRQNAKVVDALREIVGCCNEDGGGYTIIDSPYDYELFIVWQYEADEDDWSRVWWATPRGLGWSYVNYGRDGHVYAPMGTPDFVRGARAPRFSSEVY